MLWRFDSKKATSRASRASRASAGRGAGHDTVAAQGVRDGREVSLLQLLDLHLRLAHARK